MGSRVGFWGLVVSTVPFPTSPDAAANDRGDQPTLLTCSFEQIVW